MQKMFQFVSSYQPLLRTKLAAVPTQPRSTNIYGGIRAGSFPMTRTYGFNIKLQF